ncbi:MAG: AsmA-like C-terminal region-containing protein [Terriglobia bacterium]
MWPSIRIAGEGVAVRQQARAEMPPLVAIRKFSLQASLWELLRPTKHVQEIWVDGLHVQVPPHEDQNQQKGGAKRAKLPVRFVVDTISSQDAELDLLPENTGKPVRVFMIHRLDMYSVGLGRPASYRVTLTNPKPIGQINATGHFGPWNRDDPSATQVSGDFSFDHVDMQSIKGLEGTLSSQGKFSGELDHIEVEGETDTPDFALDISRNPVHLRTQYKAVVDGRNGNTLLQPVRAEFLRSQVVAEGGVYKSDGAPGREVQLNATCANAQLLDLLRLAVKGSQPMTGDISFQSKLNIPPGKEDIADRLKLDGRFTVRQAHFTKLDLAEKIKALSRAGQGKPGQTAQGSDIFNFSGQFDLKNGSLRLSNLTFRVPGADFHFNGTYALRTGAIDFHGTLSLQAKLSQTTTGIKSFLLKPLDPFFSKNHVTVLPLKITGTRADPSFGPDFRHKPKKPSS